jgi:hypothetical protein
VAEPPALIAWHSGFGIQHALWRTERGTPPPAKVVLADDTLSADTAYRLACEGTGLLWQGDFNQARQLLQALIRRVERPAHRHQAARRAAAATSATAAAAATQAHASPGAAQAPSPAGPSAGVAGPAAGGPTLALPAPNGAAAAFYRDRQAKGQRAQLLSKLLVPLHADYSIALRRSPNLRLACLQAWGPADVDHMPATVTGSGPHSVVSLRDLLGVVGAYEWRRNGVPVPALGPPPDNRIHPHYGVFAPLRSEYVQLVAQAPLPAALKAGGSLFDIGTGTGVLAAVLARRVAVECAARPAVPSAIAEVGLAAVPIVATDSEPRAVACARDNLQRLQLHQVQVVQADLFPPGRAALVVCNPPWLPMRAGTPLERAVYDEDSRMLKSFLARLRDHLLPRGEGWLVLSDLAEHLGLRTRSQLLAWVAAGGLQVLGRSEVRPSHPKATDASDPLFIARAAEVTSLWRLGLA